MSSSVALFNNMASDIGVYRFAGEDDESFCHRVAYSAARFWVSAFCLDDGAEGETGISRQAINRRLKGWIGDLEKLKPGIAEWFAVDSDGLPLVYGRLIDIGDIIVNGFNDAYVAKSASDLVVSHGFSCITGFYDPTASDLRVCGHSENDLFVSGLTTISAAHNPDVDEWIPWWEIDLDFMPWESASNFGDVKYVDAHSSCLNVNRSDAWMDDVEWLTDISLAKVERSGLPPALYAARKNRGGCKFSPITWNQAEELFFHLRDICGNKAISRYVRLDEEHIRIFLPVGFVPGDINRVLDAVGWPVEAVNDRFNRVVRAEALPLVRGLLEASSIGVREVSND